jgi:hypothetical protein
MMKVQPNYSLGLFPKKNRGRYAVNELSLTGERVGARTEGLSRTAGPAGQRVVVAHQGRFGRGIKIWPDLF